jgi:phenylalanyl-tRNA synthetase beta chain
MKISYDWLNDFVDFKGSGITPDTVSSIVTGLGFAVESTDEFGGDVVSDLDITTNRPDCLCHRGIAREIAVQLNLELQELDFSQPSEKDRSIATSVDIEALEYCPRYVARVLTGIKVGPSPDWLRARLEGLGFRSVNNVVDVTNFVMLHLGQPMHAFDYETLEEGRIVVRTGRPGETLVTLDGEKRAVDSEMLLICDGKAPIGVAGVMGGANSEVTESTRTVLLESAYFDPLQIRRTAKKLGINSEASYRFERGTDLNLPGSALNMTSRLLEEFASGQCNGPVVDSYPDPVLSHPIRLTSSHVTRITGIDIPDEDIETTLRNLEFTVQGEQGQYDVTPPSFRVDIHIEDDLVEEVLRHYGYDRVPSTNPKTVSPGKFLETRRTEERLLSVLTARGFFEAVNYAFTVPNRENVFWGEPPSMVEIANPLTEEHTHLRKSLLPGLVESVRHNAFHGTSRVRLFECGKTFDSASEGVKEISSMGLVATGTTEPDHWEGESPPFDYFDMKGIVVELANQLDKKIEFRRIDRPYLETGTGLEVLLDGLVAGVMGELVGHLHAPLRLQLPVYVVELLLDILYCKPLSDPIFKELSKFPSVDSDLSFLVDSQIDFDRIAAVVRGLETSDLTGIQLVDLYRGLELPGTKMSFTVRLTFANSERTLTQEEANVLSEAIFAKLKNDLGVEARF